MGLFIKKNPQKEMLDEVFNRIQVNLENNYKDLAIDAKKEALEKLAACEQDNSISAKDIEKYKARLAEYEKRMEGYSHRMKLNI